MDRNLISRVAVVLVVMLASSALIEFVLIHFLLTEVERILLWAVCPTFHLLFALWVIKGNSRNWGQEDHVAGSNNTSY